MGKHHFPQCVFDFCHFGCLYNRISHQKWFTLVLMWTKTHLFLSSWVSTVSFLSCDSKFFFWSSSGQILSVVRSRRRFLIWFHYWKCYIFFGKKDNQFSLECLYLLGLALLAKKMFLIDFWWNSNESCHFIWFHSSSIFIYKINELVMSCQFSVSASFTVMLPRGGHGDNNDFYARNCLDLFHRNRNDKSKQRPPHASLKTIFPHSPPRY